MQSREKVSNMAKISVILPIYNTEQYLAKCIESVCHQTYEDLEILLVNDGSTDGCEQICLDYAKKDKRIQYLKKENGGLSDARNYGIDRAKGDYLAFIDSDDFVEAEFIERLYEAITRENVSIAATTFDIVDATGHLVGVEKLTTSLPVVSGREVCKKILEEDGYRFVVVWNKLYKKDLFKELRFEKGKLHEDEYFTYRLLYEIEKVAVVQESLYHYLKRDNSISKSTLTEHRYHCLVEFQLERMDFYKKKGDIELLLLCYHWFLNFIIRIVYGERKLIAGKHQKYLQAQFRLIYQYLKKYNQVNVRRNWYYRIGYVDLNLTILITMIKYVIRSLKKII